MEAVETFGGDIGVKPACEALGLRRETFVPQSYRWGGKPG
jgi:hypothetical protein